MAEDRAETGDIDPQETGEWLEALEAVRRHDGGDRARFLLERLQERAQRIGVTLPRRPESYVNTIPPEEQPTYPGDLEIEERLLSLARWNAMAMVVRANRIDGSLGGHLSTYASAARFYDVALNHVFRGPDAAEGADLMYVQGHSSPGIYARAFIEGRLTEEQLEAFRRESDGKGISSYPHPWLMRDFWQFATVSMGLGPLMAIYQARFMRYLQNRGLLPHTDRKVWAFLGDGEMDEPESLGAIGVASREGLDNLVFVINCNLQRLDGPVRGNSSIVRELAAQFRGAGWNVIKVLWGSVWDSLFAHPDADILVKRMEEAVDGDYQRYAADPTGRLLREEFWGRDPRLAAMVEHLSDAELADMPMHRGGHDPDKVFAAYDAARRSDLPTVILFKTVKGHGLGEVAQAKNVTHQTKKLADEAVQQYRDWLGLDLDDERAVELPFLRPEPDSEEARYLARLRSELGGPLPVRRVTAEPLETPPLDAFESVTRGSGEREISTTMAFVRVLSALLKDQKVGDRVVPIVADEARTFGMEGLFRQVGIYAPFGQRYEPVDREQLAYYREERDGQILQEGITEAGAFSSWIAAGTAYANYGLHMIPFYIYYSMFGFQRIGDLAWAAADMQARGFLLGATSGRTTLNGEGLQHEDGHSHLMAATIPNCIAYDPTYAHEVAVIMQNGLERMYAKDEAVFYYLTLLNENYVHPELPAGTEDDIVRGMYRLRSHDGKKGRVQLLGSGSILREVEAAAALLESDWGIGSDVWSVTSFTELRRDGMAVRRHNRLHPEDPPRTSFVAEQLAGHEGPVVASTDYMEAYAEQIRPFVGRPMAVLGTDGFGRSDTREALRAFFEVDRRHVAVAALQALAEAGEIQPKVVTQAITKYEIDPDAPDPVTL